MRVCMNAHMILIVYKWRFKQDNIVFIRVSMYAVLPKEETIAVLNVERVCSRYLRLSSRPTIYRGSTTKIYGVVCPPNISETVADRLMKLAHRQRIASTTIKLISKKILLSILSSLFKIFSANRRWPEAPIVTAIWFGRLRSQSRSPSPGFGQNAVAIYCDLRIPSVGDRDRSPEFG